MSDWFVIAPEDEPSDAQVRERVSNWFNDMRAKWPAVFKPEHEEEYLLDHTDRARLSLRLEQARPAATAEYSTPASGGHLMTVEEFKDNVRCGGFIDYDGYGAPVKGGMEARIAIYPTIAHLIPTDASHINWFNR